jgi:hypothetical protein
MPQKFNVVRPKKYTTSDGQEKTAWLPIGTITKFDNGNSILELNDRPETYQIFPFKPKNERGQQAAPAPQANQAEPTSGYAGQGDDIKVENIPF